MPGILKFGTSYTMPDLIEGSDEKKVMKLLSEPHNNYGEFIGISIADIYHEIDKKSSSKVFDLIYRLHIQRHLEAIRYVQFQTTKIKFGKVSMIDLVKSFRAHQDQNLFPQIDAIVGFTKNILTSIKEFGRTEFNGKDLQVYAEESFNNQFDIIHFKELFQHAKSKGERIKWEEKFVKRIKKDFIEKRIKFAFFLINKIKGAKAEN